MGGGRGVERGWSKGSLVGVKGEEGGAGGGGARGGWGGRKRGGGGKVVPVWEVRGKMRGGDGGRVGKVFFFFLFFFFLLVFSVSYSCCRERFPFTLLELTISRLRRLARGFRYARPQQIAPAAPSRSFNVHRFSQCLLRPFFLFVSRAKGSEISVWRNGARHPSQEVQRSPYHRGVR